MAWFEETAAHQGEVPPPARKSTEKRGGGDDSKHQETRETEEPTEESAKKLQIRAEHAQIYELEEGSTGFGRRSMEIQGGKGEKERGDTASCHFPLRSVISPKELECVCGGGGRPYE